VNQTQKHKSNRESNSKTNQFMNEIAKGKEIGKEWKRV